MMRDWMPAEDYDQVIHVNVIPERVMVMIEAAGFDRPNPNLGLTLGLRLPEVVRGENVEHVRPGRRRKPQRISLDQARALVANRQSLPRLAVNMVRGDVNALYSAMRERAAQQAALIAQLEARLEQPNALPPPVDRYPRGADIPTEAQRIHHREQAYLMDAHYQTQLTPWPVPFDWNWMYRVINVWPNYTEPTVDWGIIAGVRSEERMKLMILMFALIRTMTTTVFYSLNVTGVNLHRWMANMEISASLNDLLTLNLLGNPSTWSNQNALIFELVSTLIEMTTGQRTEAMQYWAERWNVRRGYDLDIVAYRSPYLAFGHVPIQRQDVMCIDNYLQVRPLEWGITTPSPNLALSLLVNLHDLHVRGVYVRSGTRKYDEKSTDPEPFNIIVYGPGSMNCIAQGWFSHANRPRVRYQTYHCVNGIVPNYEWPRIQPVPARHNEYMGLGIFKPCTILSFDFNTDNILAPVLPMDDVNEPSFVALRNSDRSSNPTVGLFMGARRPIATFTSTSSDRANRLYNKRDALKEPTKVFKAGPTRNQPMYAYDMPTWIRDLYTAGGQIAQLGGVMTDPTFTQPDELREQYQPEQQPEWARIIGYLQQFGGLPPGPQIPRHPLVPQKKIVVAKKPGTVPAPVAPAKEAEDDVVDPPPVADPLAAVAEEEEVQI